MNKHNIKWFSLILSIAVFVGCAVYISTVSPVSALTEDEPTATETVSDLPSYAFGDVVAGDIVQGDYDEYIDDETGEVSYYYSDWLGDSSNPLIAATKNISQNTNDDYLINYNFSLNYLLESSDNYIFVDLSNDDMYVREGVIDAVQGYIDYLNKYTEGAKVIVQAIGSDDSVEIDLPGTDDVNTPGIQAANYLRGVETDLADTDTPTKAELEALVDDCDAGITDGTYDNNIIVIAENADGLSVGQTAADIFTVEIDPDPEVSGELPPDEAVLVDIGINKLLDLNLSDHMTEFDILDQVNAPYVIVGTSQASISERSSDGSDTHKTTVPVTEVGSGLLKASYTVPPIGIFDGTFEYAIDVDELESPVDCSDPEFTATEAFAINDPSSDYDLITLPATVIETEIPIVSIDKKVSYTGDTANKDSVLEYEIVLKNEGNVDLTKVGLTDTLICSDHIVNDSVLATTGTGSSTKTFSFTPSQSTASSMGTLDAENLTLAPGAELKVTYKLAVPDDAAGCEAYKSTVNGTTKYIIPNTATASAEEINSNVTDSTQTEILGITDTTDNNNNASGNASGDADKTDKPSGGASGNASGDSKGDDDKDKSPATGDSHNIVAMVIMVIAFIAGCVSLFLIINEKKVQQLIKSSTK